MWAGLCCRVQVWRCYSRVCSFESEFGRDHDSLLVGKSVQILCIHEIGDKWFYVLIYSCEEFFFPLFSTEYVLRTQGKRYWFSMVAWAHHQFVFILGHFFNFFFFSSSYSSNKTKYAGKMKPFGWNSDQWKPLAGTLVAWCHLFTAVQIRPTHSKMSNFVIFYSSCAQNHST